MDGISERERLRRTFDAVAEEYQDARPEYPAALYEALISLTGVVAGVDEVCEVGCASGKATLPLARRGFAISCVELGGALAAEARRNLAGFERVRVEHADFESWTPGQEPGSVRDEYFAGFGLLFAATAWHWIDPATGLGLPHAGDAARRPGRDRGQRAVHRGRGPAVRLGDQVWRR